MKLKNIEIESFRGISNSISVNFSKNDKPISTIIFGDNGTGKSSIIDAIEYNLQGKLERSDSLNNEFRPSVRNLYTNNKKCFTKTILEDDSSFERLIEIHYDSEKEQMQYIKSNNQLNHYFKIAPLALRRNDIINYSLTSSKQKQILFWSFIYNIQNKPTKEVDISDKNFINELNNERLNLKTRRKEILELLSTELKIPIQEIPLIGISLDTFIKKEIRKGFTKKQFSELQEKGVLKGKSKAIDFSEKLLQINEKIKEVQSKISRLTKLDSPSSEERKKEVNKFLDEASKYLTESFLEVSTTDFVKEIKVKIGTQTDVSFEIEIILKNGVSTFPNKIFSEANLDLLILLLYSSIIKEAEKYGQAKVLILDDVLQSVDSIIRINFIEYLLKNFKDWQIIITTHDRLWLNQLRSSFRRNNHNFKEIEIFKWDFLSGLNIFEQKSNLQNSTLKKALETKDIQLIASQTGLFLEYLCNQLTMNLNLSIQRKFEDKYTIGDLWPGVLKHFKKSSISNVVIEIDKLLHIRNLLGAHYNEWAISLSNQDVYNFANLVDEFYDKTFCNNCHSYISKENVCICNNLDLSS